MRILFMAQCYSPEEVSAAVLISELATDLAKRGHQVTMVTSAPNYPYGRLYPGYRNRFYQVERLNNVRVARTWSYISPKKNFWRRIFNYGSYSVSAFYGALLTGKPDILLNYSPPLPLGLSAWLLSRLWCIPWVLQINDVFPEAAVAAGLLRNRRMIAFFTAMERFLYKRATHISLIAENFRRSLIGKGVPSDKITLIPVWADPVSIQPLPKENTFRNQHGLNGRFVVLYAGNLGHTSALEEVVGAAEILRKNADVRFVIIGEGVKKAALEEQARKKRLENILFLPFQSRGIFAEVLAAADVSLVTLNRNSSETSFPSKVFNIMASARPILAVARPESEVANLVKEAKCGIVVRPEQPELLAKAILYMKEEAGLLREMGRNGPAQVTTKFSRAHCVERYDRMLQSVCMKDNGQ